MGEYQLVFLHEFLSGDVCQSRIRALGLLLKEVVKSVFYYKYLPSDYDNLFSLEVIHFAPQSV